LELVDLLALIAVGTLGRAPMIVSIDLRVEITVRETLLVHGRVQRQARCYASLTGLALDERE
jgi:hypothetical protein